MSGKSSSVLKVGDEVAAAVKIREALREHADDPALILDTIEGETDLFEALAAVDREIVENEIVIEGCKAVEKEVAGRRARHERANETLRGVILMAMEKAQIQTVKTATGTITARAVPPKLEVVTEHEIPARFWKQPDPVLDKKALNAAHKDGEEIPGTRLTNGGISLTIRRD